MANMKLLKGLIFCYVILLLITMDYALAAVQEKGMPNYISVNGKVVPNPVVIKRRQRQNQRVTIKRFAQATHYDNKKLKSVILLMHGCISNIL